MLYTPPMISKVLMPEFQGGKSVSATLKVPQVNFNSDSYMFLNLKLHITSTPPSQCRVPFEVAPPCFLIPLVYALI
jgi:hypothetical protein